MCINIWQKFHLLHLFSIGLMHEASVLKTFEWKLQKRAEREKGCRKGWAVGRTAGKPENRSLARAGGFGREAGVGPPRDWPGCTHNMVCSPHTLRGRLPPSLAHPPSSFSSLTFLSSHLRKQMGLRGEGGQSWEQERKALLVLFSHLRSQQERTESSRAPSPRSNSDGSPRAGLFISFLAASLVTPCQWPVMSIPLVA